MKRILFLYTFIFFFVPSFAQIEDNFSDGNLSVNPTWEGNLSNFIINTDGQLQLNATTSGQSQIYLNPFIEQKNKWSFVFKMDLNPSSSNNLRVYLQSDNADLLSGSGYFIEIGETGSIDAIKLYRQDNGNKKLLATATIGSVATNPNVRVNVIREKEGKWSVYADYSGGDNFQLEATAEDATYFGSNFYFFGFYCKYTSTKIDKFFFDDISITPLEEDITPPILIEIKTIDEKKIELLFDDLLDKNTATNIVNYLINKEVGNPQSVNLIDANQVVLNLEKSLFDKEEYTITISNIADLKGNILSNFDTIFSFTKVQIAEQYDIIINEIMEDPTLSGGSTLGLPNQEYVELYNRSNKTIDLEGFVFTDGSSKSAVFPSYLFFPNTFLIIAKTGANELDDFGNYLGLSNFPTLSSEEELVLKDEFGVIIDVVSFIQNWYQNSSNAGGGFSLERINPKNPCENSNNWKASTSFLGGTPGKENAVFSLSKKGLTLDFIDAYPIDATHLRLTFNKTINLEDAMDQANYSISNNKIINVVLAENNFSQVIIELMTPLIENKIETIELRTSFGDCIGNLISKNREYNISLPVLAKPNNIIINEILYNPQVGGVDFLELYNNSENVIDLSSLIIINLMVNNPTGKLVTLKKLFFPEEHVVFTKSPSDIQKRYTVDNQTFLLAQDLPTFPDKEGNVSIFTNNNNKAIFIDQFDYSDDFHNALLNDKNGVSLERINPNLPSQNAGNWHSASTEAGYGTPTFQNSQRIVENEVGKSVFTISSNRISPDGDGFEDILQINYAIGKEGFSATIHLYDATGRLVRKLIQNELLSTIGSFKWDGTTSDGQKAKLGIYVLWIEYINTNGTVSQMKEAVVLAGKL